MRSPRTLQYLASVAAVAALVATAPAQAADLLVDPPVVEVPEVHPAPGGWYLRGDIGYSFREYRDNGMFAVGGPNRFDTLSAIDANGFRTGSAGYGVGYRSFDSVSIDESFEIRGGLGYKVNDYLRVDGTVAYAFDADFSGSTGGDCSGPTYTAATLATFNPAGARCSSTDTDTLSRLTVMANAYVDLGNFSGFTPYVGAGIGGAHVSYSGLTNTVNCPDGVAGCTPVPVSHGGEDSWRFAWALHAGASYELTKQLALDFGYSYTRIEGGPQFSIDANSQANGAMTGAQGFDKGFEEHTIRAGLRYHLW